MLKLVFCLHRLPHLSPAEFHAHWRGNHAPLVQQHAAALGIVRYVQSHSLLDQHRFALAKARGTVAEAFDGVAELWWQDKASFAAAGQSEAGLAAGAILLEDERRFIDLPRSPIFLVEEHRVVG